MNRGDLQLSLVSPCLLNIYLEKYVEVPGYLLAVDRHDMYGDRHDVTTPEDRGRLPRRQGAIAFLNL